METINKYKPSHPLLQQVVSSFVFWRRTADCVDSIISLPNNVSGFGFTLSGDFSVSTGAQFNKMPTFGTRNLYEKTSEIRTHGDFLNISVRCTIPNSLCLFTKIPMNIIYDTWAVALEDIFTRQEIQDVSEQLLAAPSDHEKKLVIETFLLSKMVNNYPASFREVIRFIHQSKGCYNLAGISRMSYVSERTINRHFNKYIGISPNAYINLVRFRSVVDLAAKSNAPLLSNAFDVGYYDQSHFIKHFKKFSTLTPTQFFNTYSNNKLSDFYNL